MKKAYIPFAAFVVALVLTVPALADVPNLLNYQGRLTDPSGTPKNGTFTMQFVLCSWWHAQPRPNRCRPSPPFHQCASVGSSVTITGAGFDATPANNIVYFGAVRATLTAARPQTSPSPCPWAPPTRPSPSPSPADGFLTGLFTPTLPAAKGSALERIPTGWITRFPDSEAG